MRTGDEIDRAIRLLTLGRDGLRKLNLEAHAMVVNGSIEALKWANGEQSTVGDMLDNIDSQIRSATAVNN
jgi:hypothetical protein